MPICSLHIEGQTHRTYDPVIVSMPAGDRVADRRCAQRAAPPERVRELRDEDNPEDDRG